MNDGYSVIITTASNEEEAKKIIDSLLGKQLAACIQMFPVNSFYSWMGEICNDSEVSLSIKCKSILFDEIKDDIISNHSYEVPEIILLPIKNGFVDYLRWIDEVSK